MRTRWQGPSVRRGAVLVLALGALLGHVCALETEAHESPAHVVSAEPLHGNPGETPGLHAASCHGIKAGSTSAPLPAVEHRTLVPARAGQPGTAPTPAATSLQIRRPPLFILHASLLI